MLWGLPIDGFNNNSKHFWDISDKTDILIGREGAKRARVSSENGQTNVRLALMIIYFLRCLYKPFPLQLRAKESFAKACRYFRHLHVVLSLRCVGALPIWMTLHLARGLGSIAIATNLEMDVRRRNKMFCSIQLL